MNIKRVSYSLIGGLLLTAPITSCSDDSYEKKAKASAVEYLNGDNLLRAERYARQQQEDDTYNAEAVMYWDSLLTEAKVKEAYVKGQQLIKDSINKNYSRKNKYKMPLDTIINNDWLGNLKKEYAKYVNAKDFIKARDNAPDDYQYKLVNQLAAKTHYWNLITAAGKQNEAYQQGIVDERAKIKK